MEFEKYHKIKILGDDENLNIFTNPDDEIIVEEKIDGANFRFYITKEGIIVFGSRGQQLTSNEGEDTNVSKNFQRCINFIREKLKDKDLKCYAGLIFYGECCVKHTINYDWEKIPPYLGFDIKMNGQYENYDSKRLMFEALDLPMVPLIGRPKAKQCDIIDDKIVPISKYALESAKDRQAEGIVFKNYERQLFAKYVRDAFKEKNSEVFGGNPKYNNELFTNNGDFVFKYLANARIEKLIFKFVDEGRPLDMTMMGDLIRQSYIDIIEEEWKEILLSNWTLNFKDIRKKIAVRVRAVLEQVITNNALEEKK